MKAEIRLQYRVDLDPPQSDYTEFVEVLCPTELANLAHAYMRGNWRLAGVENVNFSFVSN